MVIPRESDFRKNIDWLDNNFPREVGGFFAVNSLIQEPFLSSNFYFLNMMVRPARPVLIIASFLVDK